MSETPRTDQRILDIGADGLVDGEFARGLEQEAAAYKDAAECRMRERDEARQSLSESVSTEAAWMEKVAVARNERDALRARLAAMFPLFEEARDALTAIPLASAKLHNVRLDLADRMDDVGDPKRWAARQEAPK